MKLDVTRAARTDISGALRWSEDYFGLAARVRYRQLIDAGLTAITMPEDPLGTRRPADAAGRRILHLRSCRAAVPGIARPRHLLVFDRPARDHVVVVRLLHDAMDLPAQLAGR